MLGTGDPLKSPSWVTLSESNVLHDLGRHLAYLQDIRVFNGSQSPSSNNSNSIRNTSTLLGVESAELRTVTTTTAVASRLSARNNRPGRIQNDKNHGSCTALHDTIWRNQSDLVKRLIDENNIHTKAFDREGKPAIELAAERGNVELISLLHPHKCRVAGLMDLAVWGGSCDVVLVLLNLGNKLTPNTEGVGAVPIAAKMGYVHMFELFQDRKMTSLNEPTRDGCTPLHIASEHGHKDVVAFLSNEVLDINITDTAGLTALHLAAKYGQIQVVKCLLDAKGINIDQMGGPHKQTALELSLIFNHGTISQLLIAKSAHATSTSACIDWTPLHFAAYHGNIDTAKVLIGKFKDMVDVADKVLKWTPLHLAAMKGYAGVIQVLLKSGATAASKDVCGWTPRLFSQLAQCPKTTSDLLNHRANIDLKRVNNPQNWTAMHMGAFNGDPLHEMFDRAAQNQQQRLVHHPIEFGARERLCTALEFLIDHNAGIDFKIHENAMLLHHVADNGHAELAQRFLRCGGNAVDMAQTCHELQHWAIESGRLSVLNFLIEHSGGIHSWQNQELGAPIHVAAVYGHKDVVGRLIEVGADVETANGNGKTPLSLAVRHGKNEAINLLLGHGIDLRESKLQGNQMLHVAVSSNAYETVKLLLQKYREIGSGVVGEWDMSGQTPMHIASRHGYNEIFKLLLFTNPGLAHYLDSGGLTPMQLAKEHHQDSIVQLLQSHVKTLSLERTLNGVNVHSQLAQGSEDCHEIHRAASSGDVEAVNRLIKSVTRGDSRDVTPLHLAAKHNHLAVAKIIVEKRSKAVCAKNCLKESPLEYAAAGGSTEVAEYLIRKKAKLEASALWYAVVWGHAKTAKLLISHGAGVGFLTGGQTLLHYASEQGNRDVVALLLKHGTSVNEKNKEGKTALHYSTRRGDLVAMKHLLSHGADSNAIDHYGRTPLHYATRYSNMSTVELLLSHGAKHHMQDSEGNYPEHYYHERIKLVGSLYRDK